MRKTLFVVGICLLLSAGFLLAGCGPGQEAQAGPQTTCPMMIGSKIDKNIYVDYKGKRIYFCCADCPKKFEANPEKHMKKMADTGVILEDTP